MPNKAQVLTPRFPLDWETAPKRGRDADVASLLSQLHNEQVRIDGGVRDAWLDDQQFFFATYPRRDWCGHRHRSWDAAHRCLEGIRRRG